MDTAESIIEIVRTIWRKEESNTLALAERLAKKHQLPPAAPMMIENLGALLAELQKQAFYHGVTAALSYVANHATININQ